MNDDDAFVFMIAILDDLPAGPYSAPERRSLDKVHESPSAVFSADYQSLLSTYKYRPKPLISSTFSHRNRR